MESGLSAHFLDLEIAESVIITHTEKALATLSKLRQMGVSITVSCAPTASICGNPTTRVPSVAHCAG